MSDIYKTKIPKSWGLFYLFTFLQFTLAFMTIIPFLMYVVGPVLNLVLHGVPIGISQAKALGLKKMCYFILFSSFWVSSVLWLQKFIPWYRKQERSKNQ